VLQKRFCISWVIFLEHKSGSGKGSCDFSGHVRTYRYIKVCLSVSTWKCKILKRYTLYFLHSLNACILTNCTWYEPIGEIYSR
jgi:hypothetical protein